MDPTLSEELHTIQETARLLHGSALRPDHRACEPQGRIGRAPDPG